VLASLPHLSQPQRTPSPPPLSSSCSSYRNPKLKTTNPCNHRNQQYSIIGLTNAAGTLVERYTYTAYGTLGIYDASGTVRTTSTYANRYTYTGREYDPDLNLYHFRARWHDPATGGFISRDPLGYVDGMSLYRGYFGVKGVDPNGLQINRCRCTTHIESSTPEGMGANFKVHKTKFSRHDCFTACCPKGAVITRGGNGAWYRETCTGEATDCSQPFAGLFQHIVDECKKTRTRPDGTQFDGRTEAECEDIARRTVDNLENAWVSIMDSGGVHVFKHFGNNCDKCLEKVTQSWKTSVSSDVRIVQQCHPGGFGHHGESFPWVDPGAHTWQHLVLVIPCSDNKSVSIPITTIDIYRNPAKPWRPGPSTDGLPANNDWEDEIRP
jgi:RHS repeat-associated protein